MKRNPRSPSPVSGPQVRCAVYTRKSTEEGLEQEFNSLCGLGRTSPKPLISAGI